MKPITLFLSFFAAVSLALGQVYFSNNVSRAEAIEVLSQLKVGMWEEDAGKFLATKGLTNSSAVGAKTGWNRYYGLADGSNLVLDYAAREFTSNVWGGNGILQGASIKQTSPAPSVGSLGITNTVDAKTTVRISRYDEKGEIIGNVTVLAYTNGVELLKVLDASKPWDGKSHASAYGVHAHTPRIRIGIDWSRTEEEQETHSASLCYGNRLFWYSRNVFQIESVYQIPEESYDLMDTLFPENK